MLSAELCYLYPPATPIGTLSQSQTLKCLAIILHTPTGHVKINTKIEILIVLLHPDSTLSGHEKHQDILFSFFLALLPMDLLCYNYEL